MLKVNKFLKYILLFMAIFSCTHEKDYVHQEEVINEKGRVSNSKIGLDKEDKIVIENSQRADHSLEKMIWDKQELENEIKYLKNSIKKCIRDLSDPRLGEQQTDVTIPTMPKEASEWDKEELTMKKDGELSVVKKTSFKKRYNNLRNHIKILKEYKERLVSAKEKCDLQLKNTRIKHGLSGGKKPAEGYFQSDGTWIQTKKLESNLE